MRVVNVLSLHDFPLPVGHTALLARNQREVPIVEVIKIDAAIVDCDDVARDGYSCKLGKLQVS